MSEQQPKQPPTNRQVLQFVVTLSFVCALVLAILASVLREPQEVAQELDRTKQMLIAAQILTHEGYFQIKEADGKYIPAKHVGDGILVPGAKDDIADQAAIVAVVKRRLQHFLLNPNNDLVTFNEAGINKDEYISKYKKQGYYTQRDKLIYKILPNPKEEATEQENTQAEGYVIPVNGFGLWDAIYGYIAIKPDGETVIGISWYEQKETPGLGANIADEPWQSLFPGKLIFQPSPTDEVNPKTSPIGITVVKGKVSEVIGDVPKARAAVDGMPGATLTGNGVTTAYREVLGAYRPFFVKINSQYETKKG